jgi:hypothetical protein
MNVSEPNLESLIARVGKLESQNRRWKLSAAVLALSSSALVLAGAKLADRIDPEVVRAHTVEAQNFVLKAEDGRVYARLSMNPNKFELDGHVVVVGPETTGPALQFYGENGKPIWTAPQEARVVPATR